MGNEREELEYLSWVPLCIWGGPTPVPDGIRQCRELMERAAGDRKAMSTALFVQAKLEAMRGRVEEARELVSRARSLLQEVALPVWLAGPLTQMAGWVEVLAGEVEPFLRMCEETAGSEDAYSQSLLRSVRAKLLARRGEAAAAEELGRQAVAILEPTDFQFMQCFALLSLGETLRLAGRPQAAQAVLDDAAELCERKGFAVGAGRAQRVRRTT